MPGTGHSLKLNIYIFEPTSFGFQGQVANSQAIRPK